MKSQIPTIIFFAIIGILLSGGIFYLYEGSYYAFFGSIISSKKTVSQSSLFDGKYTCSFSPGKGITTTAYIDQGTIRADNAIGKDNQQINILVTNETIYAWNPATNKGSTKKYPGIINLLSSVAENYRNSCKSTASFTEHTFDIPQNIVFTQSISASPQNMLQNIVSPQSK